MNAETTKIPFSIPNHVALALKHEGVTHDDLMRQACRLLALHYFQAHILSMGNAAQLAGMTLSDFITYASLNGIPVVDMDEEEFAREMATVEALAEELRRRKQD